MFTLSSYFKISNEELNYIYNNETKLGREFIMPSELTNEDIYIILNNASTFTNVNVFKTFISYDKDNEIEINKYVLLNKHSQFFENIEFYNSNFDIDNNTFTNKQFVSSIDKSDEKQVAIIKLLGLKDTVYIRSLETAIDSHKLDGKYFVEINNEDEYNSFIEELVSVAKINLDVTLDVNDIVSTNSTSADNLLPELTIALHLKLMFIIIIFLLIVYFVFKNSKNIGILKFNGFSKFKVWYKLIGKLLLKTWIFLNVLVCILSFILVQYFDYTFIISTLYDIFIVFCIVGMFSYISVHINLKFSILTLLKEKSFVNPLLTINFLVRSIVVFFILSIVLNSIVNINLSTNKIDAMSNWNKSSDYAVFSNFYIGDDVSQEDTFNALNDIDYLYDKLNAMGSILINSKSYEDINLTDNTPIRDIRVNNNYLLEFPVYDELNNEINVTEDDCDYIIIVPEKYKNKELQIRDYYNDNINSNIEIAKKYPYKIPNNIPNLKIIWSKNNQQIFSFNPDVAIDNNNVIFDPIIIVVTLQNSTFFERESILGGSGTDPLKIRLLDRNTSKTYDVLKDTLQKYNLDDNLHYLVKTSDLADIKLFEIRKEMTYNILILIGTFVVHLIISVQNILLILNKNKVKISVKRMFGFSFFDTYKKYILLLLVNWIISFIFILITEKLIDLQFMFIALCLYSLELLISIMFINRYELSSKIEIMKGSD